MSVQAARRRDVLDDSEATLRQVEGVLSDFGTAEAAHEERVDKVMSGLQGKPAGLRELVKVLVQTYGEIMSVVDSLRNSRNLLEQAAMERLKSTHAKLAEVSSATELAATGMLDGLDRSLVLLDGMESAADGDDSEAQSSLRNDLRDELHSLMNLLQFQDITAQQLGYAGGVLLDIEDRMVELARVFDMRGLGLEEEGDEEEAPQGPEQKRSVRVEETHTTCDPEASHFGAEGRQAVADEIFK
jgi:hypothetical protein